MNIPPLDQMPMMLSECQQAAAYVEGKFSDDLPVSRFTAENTGEQAARFGAASEQAGFALDAFRQGEERLGQELERAGQGVRNAIGELSAAQCMSVSDPCTGCHGARAAAVAAATERLAQARRRLQKAERARDQAESTAESLASSGWVSQCDEVMARMDRFGPCSANEIRAFLTAHREDMEELAACTYQVAEILTGLPWTYFGAVPEPVGDLAHHLTNMAGHADDTAAEFERLHSDEIKRLDRPRPAEGTWDVGRDQWKG
jgi:hypothetical protein